MLLKYGTGSNLTVVNGAPSGYKPKIDVANVSQTKSKTKAQEQECEGEESESEEELFDPYVLSKLKF